MIEIIFINQNKVWNTILKDYFKCPTYRYYSIDEFGQLNEWGNETTTFVIVDEYFLAQNEIDFQKLKKDFPHINTWKLLAIKSGKIDPLIFKQEIFKEKIFKAEISKENI